MHLAASNKGDIPNRWSRITTTNSSALYSYGHIKQRNAPTAVMPTLRTCSEQTKAVSPTGRPRITTVRPAALYRQLRHGCQSNGNRDRAARHAPCSEQQSAISPTGSIRITDSQTSSALRSSYGISNGNRTDSRQPETCTLQRATKAISPTGRYSPASRQTSSAL
jgi:hypothetical protein